MSEAAPAAVREDVVLPQEARKPALGLVLERVRLRARRRAAWLQHVWRAASAPDAAPEDGDLRLPRELDVALDDRDSPAAEAAWYAAGSAVQLWNAALDQVERALAAGRDSRLAALIQRFDLSSTDVDILHACLALVLDPALAEIYAFLHDHSRRGYVTEALVARLFGHGRVCVWSAESPLRRWALVSEHDVGPSEPPALVCDRQVFNWLLGYNDLDARLVGIVRLQPALPPLAGWPVTDVAEDLARRLNGREAARLRVTVSGPPGSGKRTFAACTSAELGLPLLVIDTGSVDEAEWREVFLCAQRQAFLDRCALAWCGGAAQRPWPPVPGHFPLQFLIGDVALAAQPVGGLLDVAVELPPLTLAERRRLWQQYVPAAAGWPPEALDALAARHCASPGDIARAGRQLVVTPDQAARVLREAQRGRLGGLVQALERPFNWDDLVIPEALRQSLEDLVYEAQARAAFWERPEARRLFPHGRGLVGLFTGPPGTGKTMAAQVIAGSLGLNLFRIDLSAVVSKYVGETSQNLERILSQAGGMDVVLLFDEADALFGKRTEVHDAHDRFANTDTNYLLQAIEDYPGIALLATNKKTNLDPAFTRRLRYVLDFPRPDAALRLRLWRQVLGELAGPERLEALAGRLEPLAREVEVTGAQIKYAVLSALFGAQREGRPLGLDHLLRGLERELLKDGRALSDRERERLSRGEAGAERRNSGRAH